MDTQHVIALADTPSGRSSWWSRSRLQGRQPVRIGERHVRVGTRAVSFDPLDGTSLLTAYLRLVRRVRRQQSAPEITLRRDDIVVIAEHLASSPEVVIDRLGALMGATRAQRVAMASLFASGALVIGLVGTAAADAPAPSSGLPSGRPRSAAVAAPQVATSDDTLPLVLWDPSVSADEREGGISTDAGEPPIDDDVSAPIDVDLDVVTPADEATDSVVETGLPPIPPAAEV